MLPETKIQWNKVTWYSKSLAVLLFVVLVCGAFFFGIWYQKQLTPVTKDTSTNDGVHEQSQQSTSTTTMSNGIVEIPCDSKNTAIPADAKPVASNSEYLTDAQHVYLQRQDEAGLIPDADPTTFSVLPDIDEFGMDAYHVYYAGCELPDANPETFKHLPNGTYGTDGSHVYWRWKLLSDIDATKFVSLPRGYGKDDNIVYWEDEKIQGADPATFESFEDKSSCNGSCTITAQDKNHTYMLNDIVK